MTDLVATLIVTLGLVPVIGLCVITFFVAVTGTQILMKKQAVNKFYHAVVMFAILGFTLTCVHYYFEVISWLIRG